MVNYSNSKIYKIEPTVPHEEDEVYYGATTKQYMCQRWGNHVTDYRRKKLRQTTVKNLFDKYGIDNCSIVLIELFPCETKDELSAREGYYIRNNPCVNRLISGRGKTEYRRFYMSITENRERKSNLQRQKRQCLTDEEKEQLRIRHNELQQARRKK